MPGLPSLVRVGDEALTLASRVVACDTELRSSRSHGAGGGRERCVVAADEGELELLREAADVRSRDLVDARVGLAQAVAALTDELAARRREAEAARAECAELRTQLAAERDHVAAALAEAAAQRERADYEHGTARDLAEDLRRLRRTPLVRCASAVRRWARRAAPGRR